jgi:Putative DNA-binding domain
MLQLVGADFFRQMARQFIARYPSSSANLFDYGAELADVLRALEAIKPLPYLPDVAMLEWACHRAYYAADAGLLDIAALGQVNPDDYAALYLHLHPACQLLSSRYPIGSIWQAHQGDIAADFQLDLTTGGGHVLVYRQRNVVQIIKLASDAAHWLQALLHHHILDIAIQNTLHLYPDFNVSATLLQLTALDVFSHFSLRKTA